MKIQKAKIILFALGFGFTWNAMNICFPNSREEEIPIINNPSKPSNPRSGRTLGLREVFRITDEAGDFVFRSPTRIQITEDETIFLGDKGDRLGRGIIYLFRNGTFIKNIIQIGQGPGEFPYGVNGFFASGNLVVLNKYPTKFVWCDSSGNQVREIPVAVRIPYILASCPPYLIGASMLTSGVDRKTGIKTTYYPIRAVDDKGTVTPIPITLFTKAYLEYPSGGGVASSPITEILSAFQTPEEIYLSHTTDYLVSVFSCNKRQFVFRFKRDYKPVKRKSGGSFKGISDVENDVQGLFTYRDKIWVLTSTEKDRHPLIDVFDTQGKYLDAFYLPMDIRELKNKYGQWNAMITYKDSFYIIQEDKKADLALVKYLIED